MPALRVLPNDSYLSRVAGNPCHQPAETPAIRKESSTHCVDDSLFKLLWALCVTYVGLGKQQRHLQSLIPTCAAISIGSRTFFTGLGWARIVYGLSLGASIRTVSAFEQATEASCSSRFRMPRMDRDEMPYLLPQAFGARNDVTLLGTERHFP